MTEEVKEDYELLLLTLREQFDDEKKLDEMDINFLFEIINLLTQKTSLYEKILREGRHIISN